MENIPTFQPGYASVNGISMYYEIHGNGNPPVLIHGGGEITTLTNDKWEQEYACHLIEEFPDRK